MWLAFTTMTTVGYGDFAPKTNMGRFLAVMAALSGIFLISLLVGQSLNFAVFSG
jgi:voltage-gated potassium channel